MRRSAMCAVGILVLSLGSGCAALPSAPGSLPVPAALAPLDLEECWLVPGACVTAPVPGGLRILSLREEDSARPDVAFTARGWAALQQWTGALIRAYCEGREALQAANGQTPAPAEICSAGRGDAEEQRRDEPPPAADEPQRTAGVRP